MKRPLIRSLLPLLIVGASIACAAFMVRSPEPTGRDDLPVSSPPLAPTVTVRAEALRPRIHGRGAVEPAREVTLASQLGGRVMHVSPSLVVGGRVSKGEVLLRIDARDYEIAVAQRRAQVRQAEVALELEEAHGKVAKRDWDRMGDPKTDARLPLRQPQHEAAEAALDSARLALRAAKLDLRRTQVEAPFEATVKSESVEVGQMATPNQAFATLVGTGKLWVRASVSLEELDLITVPGPEHLGSGARIVQRLGVHGRIERQGRAIRLLSDLDAQSHTAQVLVEVERRLDPQAGQLPLLFGAYVEVEFIGRELSEVVAVPRVAVFDGRFVWVVDDEERLHKRALTIAWSDPQRVYSTSGLREGERVVTDSPSPALEGLLVTATPVERDEYVAQGS